MFLFNLLKISVLSIIRLFQWLFILIKTGLSRLPLSEKLFSLSWLFAMIFLIQEWRSYALDFSKDFIIARHRIYADDFLLYTIILGFSLVLWLLRFTEDSSASKAMQKINTARLLLILVAFGIFCLTLLFPERVAPTDEASFTWQFYCFGLSLASCLITGYSGIKNYAQYPSNA